MKYLNYILLITVVGLLGYRLYTQQFPASGTLSMERPTPEFSLATLDTTHMQSDGFKVVNFFASWCGVCLKEHPILLKLAAENPTVKMYGIAFKDKPEKTVAWLKKHGDPFAIIADDTSGSASVRWGIRGVPETFVIDPNGQIIWHFSGMLRDIHYNEITALINNR